MIRLRAIATCIAASVTLYSSPASADCLLPHAISNGQVADASRIMDNFNAVVDCAVNATQPTGIPRAGEIAVFSGDKSISGGNLTGDVTTHGNTATSLAVTGVVPGTYTNSTISVDAKGRVTAAASGSLGSGGEASAYWGHASAGVNGIAQVTATLTSGISSGSPSESLWPFPRNNWYWQSGNTSAKITFDFGEPVVISGVAFFQDKAADQGMWQVSASNDGMSYTNIGVPGAWGLTARTSIVFPNASSYRYWRLTQTNGSTSSAPWQQMFMFRWGAHS